MGRVDLVSQKVKDRKKVYFTVDPSENFYLTRFRSTFGVSIVFGDGGALFLTDGRYIERAEREVQEFKVLEWEGWEKLLELLKEKGVETVIVDPVRIKLSTVKKLSQFNVEESEGFLNEFRSVKDEEELSYIVRAVQIAELSLKSVLHLLKPGTTELAFRRELLSAFLKFGGEGEAFPTIVASGPNSSVPHWETGKREIRDGDVVIVDFGTVYRGYVSDITRTFLIGNVPSQIREIYNAVREAQELGIRELCSGKSCRSVDGAVREFLKSKGFGDYFVHSLGHGIGVEVHESPTISQRSKEVLKKGNVVTVEPGVYVPGLGGVRIEDDCFVTDGGAFVISTLEK